MKRRALFSSFGAALATFPGLCLAQSFGGFLDASAYGLIANSSSDQSTQLLSAVQAAVGLGYPLFIPAGRYQISNIDLPSNCKIIGVPGSSIFVSAPYEQIFFAHQQNRIHLEGLVFDGIAIGEKSEELDALTFEACSSLGIINCEIRNFSGNGIHLTTSSGRIENCFVHHVGQTGIWGQNNSNLRITNNQISNCHNGGIRVMRYENEHDGTIVTNNQISGIGSDWGNGQNGNGINIFHADEVIVANNVITDCALSAIRANSTNNTIIRGNQCINSQEVAIFSEFAFSGSIISNNIVDGAATGISITNFDDGGRLAICANNIVRNILPFSPTNPDTTPVGIFAEADTAITGNLVENVPGVGIGAGWGAFLRNVLVSNNIVRQTKIGIAVSVVAGAGAAKINDNMIIGASEAALAGAEWTQIVTADLAKDNGLYPQISTSENTIVN